MNLEKYWPSSITFESTLMHSDFMVLREKNNLSSEVSTLRNLQKLNIVMGRSTISALSGVPTLQTGYRYIKLFGFTMKFSERSPIGGIVAQALNYTFVIL
jgi:hypothetical protein